MALPKQVRQQIAESQAIEAGIRAEQTAAATPAATPAEPTPVVAPAAETQPVTVVAEAPAPVVPAPAPTPAPAPDAQMQAQYADLVQKYRTLQGVHRALVHDKTTLQSQVQTLQASVQQLTTEVERLRQPAASAAPVTAGFTPEEMEEYGGPLLSTIEKKLQQVTAPLNAQLAEANDKMSRLMARNAELEQSLNGVTQVQAKVSQDQFTARLLQLVPDINALNYDQNFLAWLSQVDPLDARKHTLQQQLDEAVQMGDAETASQFFATYKSLVAQARAAGNKTAATNAKPDLAAQAQPVSRAAPDTIPAQNGRQWTANDINTFYSDVSKGKYSPAEKVRIEKEIFAAQSGGRIAA